MQNTREKNIQGYRVTTTKVGEGAFGEVYLAFNQQGQKLVAKVVNRDEIQGRVLNYLQSQISALKNCENEHIVKFIDIKKTASSYYLFLEYCDGGDLAQYIKTKGKLSEEQALKFFFQIVKGFKTIVKKSFVHRDLKTANILLKDGKIKIGDFGLVKLLNANTMARTFAGSPYNMAPQILKHQDYDNKVDVYSIGTVLYQMLFGCPPFGGLRTCDIIQQIKSRRFSKFDRTLISKQTSSLLSKLLKQKPSERMSWDQLFKYQTKMNNKLNAKLYKKYQRFLSKINFTQVCAIPSIFCLMNSQNINDRSNHDDTQFLDLNLCSKLFINLMKSTSIQS